MNPEYPKPTLTGPMNEINRFAPKKAKAADILRMAALLAISCLMLALGACQSARPLSDRMESKYSLKKRKTSISRLRPQGPERCDVPVQVSERAFRAMLDSIEESKGVKYRFGGSSPEGFDCSGFVQYLYNRSFQMMLPRTSTELALVGPIIRKDHLQPGDLVFFAAGADITHVGVYIGNKQFAHASTRAGISVNALYQSYYNTNFAFGTRVIRVE
ncbi:NlpC/P60 family protein [Chlorobaculum thiosulfatiphilum]|uniref:NlpC/P60 family protein n=1 Tax=Chlorobaculum thiosulfatiphilum TaxID=115852 RepID=A0A5C4S890_CHLTI|nr:C40 family peptidase [Chlorobaculum thiosulfatiphilum]TNJ39001.1 NlpC/P60 family protein [Chlorobaculum thiosulfatiphilum]